MNEVDSDAAEKLYKRAWKLDFSADSYEDIKSGIESTLTKLGAGDGVGLVTCSMVGDLYDGPNGPFPTPVALIPAAAPKVIRKLNLESGSV